MRYINLHLLTYLLTYYLIDDLTVHSIRIKLSLQTISFSSFA